MNHVVRSASRERPILTSGAIAPQLVRLAVPMMVGILAMLAFNMVDTFFVGRLGTRPLAAMALTFPIVMSVTSLSLGLSVSTSIAVSQLLGRGDEVGARRLTTDSLLLALVLGLCVMGIGYVFLGRLLGLLGASAETSALAAIYLRIWLAGVPILVLQMTGNMAIRATGDTLTTGLLLAGAMVFNGLLDPLLIFGIGSIPGFGIAGAAIATLCARALAMLAGFWLLFRFRLMAPVVPSWQVIGSSWGRLLRNGIPIALNNLIAPFTFAAMTWLVTRVAEEAMGGYGVANRVESVLLVPVFSLQSVLGIFIGQNSGAGRWDRVRSCVRISSLFAILWGIGVFALLALTGRRIAGWFNPSPEVVGPAFWYFMLAGSTVGFRGLYFVLSASLNSINRAFWATLLTLLKAFVINVPASWILGRHFGVPGIFGGIAVGNILGGVLGALFLRDGLIREARKPIE